MQLDIWSLGIILLNLLSGSNPWYQASLSDPIFLAYTTHSPSIIKDYFGLSEELGMLIKDILDVNPDTRISTSDLIRRFSDIKDLRKPPLENSLNDYQLDTDTVFAPNVHYFNDTELSDIRLDFFESATKSFESMDFHASFASGCDAFTYKTRSEMTPACSSENIYRLHRSSSYTHIESISGS